MPVPPHHSGPYEAIADNGLRFVGAAVRELFRVETDREPELPRGDRGEPIFGVSLVLLPRAGESVMPQVLQLLREAVRNDGMEIPVLKKGHALSLPADRTSGLIWRDESALQGWTGELLWRSTHPTVRGARITYRVVLEERRAFDRLKLRVTADDGAAAVHGPVGAGQVRPPWLDEVGRRFDVQVFGGPSRIRTLDELAVDDFVRSTLLDVSRKYPVAVQAPQDDDHYALHPDEVARELLGVAPLFVIDQARTTWRLTAAVGDRRLSCYSGALRLYMPGFTARDDPYDHPLLVRDRLVDPVMRATEIGRAALRAVRTLEMPPPLGGDEEEDSAAEAPPPPPGAPRPARTSRVRAPGEGGTTPADTAPDRPGTAGEGSAGPAIGADAHAAPSTPPPAGASPPEGVGPAAGTAASPNAASAVAPGTPVAAAALPPAAPVAPAPPDGSELVHLVEEFARGRERWGVAVEHLTESLDRLVTRVEQLTEEMDRLRTLTNVRSAGTASLERQIARLRDEVEARLPPELTWTVPGRDESGLAEGGGELESDGPVDALLTVVRAAVETWPDELLFLPQALESAAESPYEDADQVGAVLEAMAKVARRRMTVGLGVPLREAFREFGVDYRGGISDSTSARLREQYYFVDRESPEQHRYDCVEHIALGNARDPRYCLRIYFTSRARTENRFVIGHVGNHFEIGLTN